MMDINAIVQTITILALPLVFAITLHEAAHGYVARYFGDSTAWQAGRISLNPLRHIDPVGTILIPLSILLFSGGNFLFGYAKPVACVIPRKTCSGSPLPVQGPIC